MTSFVGIVSVVTLLIALATFVKTRRIGPVVGVLIAGAVVLVAKDSAVMQSISSAVGSVFTTISNAVPGLIGG